MCRSRALCTALLLVAPASVLSDRSLEDYTYTNVDSKSSFRENTILPYRSEDQLDWSKLNLGEDVNKYLIKSRFPASYEMLNTTPEKSQPADVTSTVDMSDLFQTVSEDYMSEVKVPEPDWPALEKELMAKNTDLHRRLARLVSARHGDMLALQGLPPSNQYVSFTSKMQLLYNRRDEKWIIPMSPDNGLFESAIRQLQKHHDTIIAANAEKEWNDSTNEQYEKIHATLLDINTNLVDFATREVRDIMDTMALSASFSGLAFVISKFEKRQFNFDRISKLSLCNSRKKPAIRRICEDIESLRTKMKALSDTYSPARPQAQHGLNSQMLETGNGGTMYDNSAESAGTISLSMPTFLADEEGPPLGENDVNLFHEEEDKEILIDRERAKQLTPVQHALHTAALDQAVLLFRLLNTLDDVPCSLSQEPLLEATLFFMFPHFKARPHSFCQNDVTGLTQVTQQMHKILHPIIPEIKPLN